MACSERDAGFCSGGDEDDMSELHSPSASEDSVEVQVTPISLRNKRKLAEPRKIQEPNTAPLKKRKFDRVDETVVADEETRSVSSPSPFRPWSTNRSSGESKTTVASSRTTNVADSTATTLPPTISPTTATTSDSNVSRCPQEEIRKANEAPTQGDDALQRLHETTSKFEQSTSENRTIGSSRRESRHRSLADTSPAMASAMSLSHPRLQDEPLSLVLRGEVPRVPSHPAVSGSYERAPSYLMEHHAPAASSHRHHQDHRSHQSHEAAPSHALRHHHQSGQQRNYKNMTRERRIEANARERTRVHTISAAFDTLRRAIPAYSHNQKLSKLSVLRIACSYIMTLSKIVNTPMGEVTSGLGACVDLVSRTIQTEGKLRKRKDD